MSSPLEQPLRSPEELAPADRARLEAAYKRLRRAVEGGERFRGGELKPGQDVVPVNGREMADAYAEIRAAEEDLWALREQLLGWRRPGWTPPAAFVADWFSEDDAVYDSFDPQG